MDVAAGDRRISVSQVLVDENEFVCAVLRGGIDETNVTVPEA